MTRSSKDLRADLSQRPAVTKDGAVHRAHLPYRVCFVCTGNICRSPMAESMFRHQVAQARLDHLVEVDSAGTGPWHVGRGAHRLTAALLSSRGYRADHRARQFDRSWFATCDLVVALDRTHADDLLHLAPGPEAAAKVRLLRSFDPASIEDSTSDSSNLDVPDPYYGSEPDYVVVHDLIAAAIPGMLEHVRAALDDSVVPSDASDRPVDRG